MPQKPQGVYCVVQYTKDGKQMYTISGMGRNSGTMDSTHGRRTAQRHAKELRATDPQYDYKVEKTV